MDSKTEDYLEAFSKPELKLYYSIIDDHEDLQRIAGSPDPVQDGLDLENKLEILLQCAAEHFFAKGKRYSKNSDYEKGYLDGQVAHLDEADAAWERSHGE